MRLFPFCPASLRATAIKRFQDTFEQNCVYLEADLTNFLARNGGGGGEFWLPWKCPSYNFTAHITEPMLSVQATFSNSSGRTKRRNLWNFLQRIFFGVFLFFNTYTFYRPPLLISVLGFFLDPFRRFFFPVCFPSTPFMLSPLREKVARTFFREKKSTFLQDKIQCLYRRDILQIFKFYP